MAKNVEFTLDRSSIAKAISELNTYKRYYRRSIQMLNDALVKEGVQIASIKIVELGAVWSGSLAQSIQGAYSPASGIGVIFTDNPVAFYVEYGTGVVGSQNPHPDPKGWKYDINSHGEDGWWYWGEWDNNWHWTKGMSSRPFMYETAQELKSRVHQVARGLGR